MNSPGIIYDQRLFNSDIRKDLRNCVLFILFFYVVNMIATVVVMMVAVVNDPAFQSSILSITSGNSIGFIGTDIAEIVTSIMSGPILGLMSIVGIAAGSCVFFIYRKKRFFTDVCLPAAEKMTPKIFIILVVITQGIQGVYSLIVTFIDYLLPEGMSLTESYGQAMDGLYTPVGFLYVVLIGPIFEELIFRGAVMGVLKRFGNNFAILFSALLFGFYHALILQIPFAFVLGLLLGYVASRWSLRAAIALHIAVNGLSVVASVFPNEWFQISFILFMIACAIATAIMAIVWRDKLKTRISEGQAYYENTYKYGFSSIAFWVFAVVMTLIGLMQMSML